MPVHASNDAVCGFDRPRATNNAVWRVKQRNREKTVSETGIVAGALVFAIALGATGMMVQIAAAAALLP